MVFKAMGLEVNLGMSRLRRLIPVWQSWAGDEKQQPGRKGHQKAWRPGRRVLGGRVGVSQGLGVASEEGQE